MFENQYGSRVYLNLFNLDDITSENTSWLNDHDVVQFSNQRFYKHTPQSSVNYFHGFEGTPNLFIAIRDVSSKKIIGTMTAYISEHHKTVDMGILLGSREY